MTIAEIIEWAKTQKLIMEKRAEAAFFEGQYHYCEGQVTAYGEMIEKLTEETVAWKNPTDELREAVEKGMSTTDYYTEASKRSEDQIAKLDEKAKS
jgi:hypothetical protein